MKEVRLDPGRHFPVPYLNSHPTDLSRRASGLPVAGYRCCLSRQVGHPASSQGGSLDSSGEHRAREFPEAHPCSACALGLHQRHQPRDFLAALTTTNIKKKDGSIL